MSGTVVKKRFISRAFEVVLLAVLIIAAWLVMFLPVVAFYLVRT